MLFIGGHHRREIDTEEKVKVVAAAWWTEFNKILAALDVLHQYAMEERMNCTRDDMKKRINSSFSSNRQCTNIVLGWPPWHSPHISPCWCSCGAGSTAGRSGWSSCTHPGPCHMQVSLWLWYEVNRVERGRWKRRTTKIVYKNIIYFKTFYPCLFRIPSRIIKV